ncbi:MAG: glycosyltransferase family 39 protein [Candidatus Roseilinea sp.]|uniref:glycosyltransferase family 39 protein n=1 Tax=Candidatus Roseilinea sp. TaxID=2838777 RepID=UPI00404B4249
MAARRARLIVPIPILLALLGLLAAHAVRAAWLGDQDVWWDEGLAVWAVRQPIAQTTLWTAGDVHPPLYFWLLWGWIRLAGETPFAMRYLTLALGMLTVAVSYPLARRLGGEWAGALAVWITGMSRFMVWWSQEMRMYMLAALMSLIALYFTLRFLDAARRSQWGQQVWRNLVLYALAATGAMYTIYLSAANLLLLSLIVALAGLTCAIARQWRHALVTLGGWFVANLAVIALVIPWLTLAFSAMRSWSVAVPTSLAFPFQLYGVLLATGISINLDTVSWAAALVSGVLVAGMVVALTTRRPAVGFQPPWLAVALLTLTLLVPPFVLYVLTQPGRTLFYVPRLEARYFVPFAPYLLAGLAWAIVWIGRARRWAGATALLTVAGLFAWSLPGYYANRHLSDGFPSLVRTIRAYAEPGDGVALISGSRYPTFLYEYDREGLSGYRAPVIQIPRRHPTLTPDNIEAELAPLLTEFSRLWVVLADPHMEDPDALALPWLQARRETALDERFNDKRLVLLAGAPSELYIPLSKARPQFHLARGGEGRVPGYDLPVQRAVPGLSVYQAVYVQAPSDSIMQLSWRHESGREMMPRWIALSAAPDRVARFIMELPVYSATPAGQYQLILRWVDGKIMTLPGPRVDSTRALPAPNGRIEQPAQVGPFELLGFAIEPTSAILAPGETLTLRLDWRVQQPPDRRYTFFVHLLGDAFNPATSGPVWAGQDSEPLNGGLPTLQWWTGEIIRDEVTLALPGDTPRGAYQIEIGAYPTGGAERVDVSGEGADSANRRVLLRAVVQVR